MSNYFETEISPQVFMALNNYKSVQGKGLDESKEKALNRCWVLFGVVVVRPPHFHVSGL
jgi:hypothetical protein